MNRCLFTPWGRASFVVALALAGLPAMNCGSVGAEPLDPLDGGPPREPPTQYTLRDVTMTLRRTECFGSCPAYTLTIRGDGLCTLSGSGEPKWTSSYSIPQKDAWDLLDDFYGSDFFVLRSTYTDGRFPLVQPDGRVREVRQVVSDVPHVFLTLTIGNYSKMIERTYDYGPKALAEIADRMDRITDAKGRVQRQRYRKESVPHGSKK